MAEAESADKELLAYILQKNTVDPQWFVNSSSYDFPNSYYGKSSSFPRDAGDALVSIAKEYVTAQTICIGSIPFLVGTGYAFVNAPNHFTAALFLATFTTFIVSREVAVYKSGQVGTLKGVAEGVSISTQKTASLEIPKNAETNINMTVGFRNLLPTDNTIQADITKAFTAESLLSIKDAELKSLYQEAVKNTKKLKALYSSYIPSIGKKVVYTNYVSVLGKDIIVKGSSDALINISSSLQGDNLKIKATSSSSEDINFNLKVGYKRSLDGKEIVKDIPCLFKGSAVTIGSSYQGGIEAYVFKQGDPGYVVGEQHGIIAAPYDIGGFYLWQCQKYPFLRVVNRTALGTGMQNTLDIIATNNCSSNAAAQCADLILNGYKDWYLPSQDELYKLYENRILIGGFTMNEDDCTVSGGSNGVYGSTYWSSTAIYSAYPYVLNFKNGNTRLCTGDFVDERKRVRAVRSF